MKFALITGATKGIGKAVAENLLAEGYAVILNYAHDEEAANLCFETFNQAHPGKVSLIKKDLGSIENVDPFFEEVKSIASQIDVLMFNVGKTDRSKLEDVTYQNWKNSFDANLTVPFFLIQKFLPLLVKKANILFTGSSMGVYPHAFSISYGVSKAAVHALVKNLVKFLAAYNVRINAVVPGFVDTEWQAEKPADIRKSIESKIALNRFCSPGEVAQACLFLINNKYMNGELLSIDGGYDYR